MCIFVIGLLFVHDCLLHDCSFPCMTACRLCLWGTCVSPYSESLVLVGHSHGLLMLFGSLTNCLPSTKLGFGIRSSIRAISMYGSTMEMTNVRAMKTCIALS